MKSRGIKLTFGINLRNETGLEIFFLEHTEREYERRWRRCFGWEGALSPNIPAGVNNPSFLVAPRWQQFAKFPVCMNTSWELLSLQDSRSCPTERHAFSAVFSLNTSTPDGCLTTSNRLVVIAGGGAEVREGRERHKVYKMWGTRTAPCCTSCLRPADNVTPPAAQLRLGAFEPELLWTRWTWKFGAFWFSLLFMCKRDYPRSMEQTSEQVIFYRYSFLFAFQFCVIED